MRSYTLYVLPRLTPPQLLFPRRGGCSAAERCMSSYLKARSCEVAYACASLTKRLELKMVLGLFGVLSAASLNRKNWYPAMLRRGLRLLLSYMAGGTIKDTQCAFKLFTRDTARLLFVNQVCLLEFAEPPVLQ